jgi:hypothetical protein
MKAVIPVLREIIGDTDDQDAPTKGQLAECVSQPREDYWQCVQRECRSNGRQHHTRKDEAGDIQRSFVAAPVMPFIQPGESFHDAEGYRENKKAVIIMWK